MNEIKRLVLTGCGIKGTSYTGVYRALDDTGILDSISDIAGVSAGSLSAAMIAVGIPHDVIREKIQQNNFPDLLGKRCGRLFQPNPTGQCALTRSGKPLEDFIRNTLIQGLQSQLEHVDIKLYPELKPIVNKFQQTNPCLTFRDLDTLHKSFPTHFKQLTVTAVTHPDGILTVFNAKLTPDVDIALACRASSSIPILFAPVEIDGQLYHDGGVHDFNPSEHFDLNENNEYLSNKHPNQTLVCAFAIKQSSGKNDLFEAIHGASNSFYNVNYLARFQSDKLPRHLVGLKPPYSNVAQTSKSYERIKNNYALRCIELQGGHLGAFDFSDAKKYARTLEALGYLDTVHFIVNHELHVVTFNEIEFYTDIVNYFNVIYHGLLKGFRKNINDDSLVNSMDTLTDKLKVQPNFADETWESQQLIIYREIYQLIKDKVNLDFNSHAAFSLTRAVELKSGLISPKQVIHEAGDYLWQQDKLLILAGLACMSLVVLSQNTKNTSIEQSLITSTIIFLLWQSMMMYHDHHVKEMSDQLLKTLRFDDEIGNMNIISN